MSWQPIVIDCHLSGIFMEIPAPTKGSPILVNPHRAENPKQGRLESRPDGRSSFIRDPGGTFSPQSVNGVAKKEKRTKKERKGRPVEAAAPMKIDQGGLRQHSYDDFYSCLENPAGFSTATTGPAAGNIN